MMLVSQDNPAGHVAVARLLNGARVLLNFHENDVEQDVTEWLCDLFLMGLAASQERSSAVAVLPPEEEVAAVVLRGQVEDFLLIYTHPASAQVLEVAWEQVAPLVSSGVAAQITAGVAAEAAAAEMPDDVSTLTPDS